MDRLQCFYGKDYNITDKLSIKHPKLLEIIEIGQDVYNEYISALTLSAVNIADILYDKFNIWYTDISDWELFINNFIAESQNNENIIKSALLFFTNMVFEPMKDKDNNIVLYNKKNDVVLNEFSFNAMVQFIKEINYITDAGLAVDDARAELKELLK